MSPKYLVIVDAAVTAVLIGATALATTESAFAGGYTKSQAVNQVNECGNGELPLNVICDNINSQVQGDDNGVGLTGMDIPTFFDHEIQVLQKELSLMKKEVNEVKINVKLIQEVSNDITTLIKFTSNVKLNNTKILNLTRKIDQDTTEITEALNLYKNKLISAIE